MQFFVIMIEYTVPIEEVRVVTPDHREWLTAGYEKGWFLASGPQNPPEGGLIVARAPDRASIESFMAHDPFVTRKVARHQFVEFDPVKKHPVLGGFFEE